MKNKYFILLLLVTILSSCDNTDKILEKANTIGKERIKTLFTTFGFNVVNVTVTDIEQPGI